MKVKYYCHNLDCAGEGSKPSVLEIPYSMIDEDHIAEIFCPRCKRTLVRSSLGDDKIEGEQ